MNKEMILEKVKGTEASSYLTKLFQTPSFTADRVIAGSYEFNSFSECISSMISKRSIIEAKATETLNPKP